MFEKILDLLDAGGETRNIEFKKTYDWADPQHKAKIVKCVLAMSNTKDGGYLVLGIDDEQQGEEKLRGMENEHYEKINYDHIVVEVNKFADPPIAFNLYKIEQDNKKFILIRINEFSEIPIVCKRSGEQQLKEGAIYSRSKSKPESAIIRSQSEMRELIDMAINKGIKEFYTRVREAGLQVVDEETSEEMFNSEIEGIENFPIMETIKSKGYWRIVIRPCDFQEDNIDTLARCRKVLLDNQLNLRGWNFPHLNESHVHNGSNFIQTEVDFNDHKEFLRFYKSGQFVYYRAVREDYIDERYLQKVNGKGLEILNTLYILTEIIEFASRLAQQKIFDENISINIQLFDMKGRQLFFFDQGRSLFRNYVSTIANHFCHEVIYDIEELITSSKEIAINILLELYELYCWDASSSIAVFKEEQQKLLKGIY